MYLREKGKFDLTSLGFESGAPYVYCGPGGDYQCKTIPEDGMICVQGCSNRLQDCGVQADCAWPCIADKEECHCSDCGGLGGASGEPNEATIAKLTDCVLEKLAEKAAA